MLAQIETDPDDKEAALGALRLHTYSRVVIPINDNDNPTRAGGSHWSVVVYDRASSRFVHLDSVRGLNRRAAATAVHALAPLIQPSPARGDGVEREGGDCESAAVPVHEMERAPQQRNASDCGAFVLAHTETLLRRGDLDSLPSTVSNDVVFILRQRLLDMARGMAARKER